MTRIWTLEDALTDHFAAIAQLLLDGGVVILPTDTIYGLHARATDPMAVQSVFEAKDRDLHRPLVVLGASLAQLETLGLLIDPKVRRFLDSVWPAALTAILPLRAPIAPTGGQATLACRIPAIRWLRELIALTGPLVSSSVNPTGAPPIRRIVEVPKSITRRVAAIVDAGPLLGEASTIVEFANDELRLIREGAVEFSQNLWKTL